MPQLNMDILLRDIIDIYRVYVQIALHHTLNASTGQCVHFITSLGWLFNQLGASTRKLSETISTRFCFLNCLTNLNMATQIMQKYSEEIEGSLVYDF